jgi:HD superfamily phosphohydrolase
LSTTRGAFVLTKTCWRYISKEFPWGRTLKQQHSTIIRDPIHNYISISRLERNLIDDPLFQRLRYVSQNGLAHIVYPSNRTSRFLHSLGAMHIAGQFLLRAIANSSREDLTAFWEAAGSLIQTAAKRVYGTDVKSMDRHLRESDDPFYRESGFDPREPSDQQKIILLQAVRLAAVMHDLGHLPFSHTVEDVLSDNRRGTRGGSPSQSRTRRQFEDVWNNLPKRLEPRPRGTVKLHELIGVALMNHIFNRIDDTNYSRFALVCFGVATAISSSEKGDDDNTGAVLECLHSIVSSDTIDADRCDYVRRDGYASGFEFGDFDLHRILSGLRLHRRNGRFTLATTTVATSALEAFFLERYRIYRWLVFHPMSQRAGLALSRALAILLEIWFNEVVDDEEILGRVRRCLKKADFHILWSSFEIVGTCDTYVR